MKITIKNQYGEIILDDNTEGVTLGVYESTTKNLMMIIDHACNKLKELTNEKANYEIT